MCTTLVSSAELNKNTTLSNMVTKSEWDEWYDKVYGFFYRRIDSRYDTEELTAQTLNAYFLNNTDIANPQAYIWGIARNQLNTYIKKKIKMRTQEISLDDEHLDTIADETHLSKHYNAKMEALQQCIKNNLIPRDQSIVRLCIEEDFDSKEVAQQLSMTSVAVRSRLSRAVAKLRDKCRSIWLENINA